MSHLIGGSFEVCSLLDSLQSAHSLILGIHPIWGNVLGYYNRFLPKTDHSGTDARIVLEQNKFSKKVTSNRD